MPIPQKFISPKQFSSKEFALRQIREWIIDGTLAPGEKINDTELSKVLGISRTPVREALQLLEAQNFVEIMPGRKTIVTTINNDELKLILPPIAALNAVACELVIDQMQIDDQFIAELQAMNQQIAADIRRENFVAANQHDLDFHNIILQASHNKYIDGMLSMMLGHIRRLICYQHINLSSFSIEEHQRLIQALKQRDKKLAAQYSTANWNRPLEEYFKMQA